MRHAATGDLIVSRFVLRKTMAADKGLAHRTLSPADDFVIAIFAIVHAFSPRFRVVIGLSFRLNPVIFAAATAAQMKFAIRANVQQVATVPPRQMSDPVKHLTK